MLRSDSDSRARLEYFLPSSPTPCTVYIERTPFTIGRTEDADLPIESTSVSREHARIEKTATGYRIVDLGSTNGTEVNGKPITNEVVLDGDALRIADVDITFCSSAMGRLQRLVTRPINGAATPRRETAVPNERIEARRRNEALLWQTVPVEWHSIIDVDSQQPVARLPTIVAQAAARRSDVTEPFNYAQYQLLRSAWHFAARQRDSEPQSTPVFLPVQWCDGTESRLLSDLFDAAALLPNDIDWGVLLSWEFFELATHRPQVLTELQRNAIPFAIDSFVGVAADLEATGAFVPELVVLGRSLVEGIPTHPRRIEQLVKLVEYCRAKEIRLALPTGLTPLVEEQCYRVGIRLQHRSKKREESVGLSPPVALAVV